MKPPVLGSQKHSLLLVSLFGCALSSLALSACTFGTRSEAGKHAQAGGPQFRLQELETPVPTDFADAQAWNKQQICPEGSVLTPFTRYSFEPGEDSHGFKYYYGRGCTLVRAPEPDTLAQRGLASLSPPASISLMPHGPYIWWYETGAKMEGGSFEHGTLALGSSQYEPDGSHSRED